MTTPSQKRNDSELESEQEKHTSECTNKIKEDATLGLVIVKDEELRKDADLTSSDGSEQDSPKIASIEGVKVRSLILLRERVINKPATYLSLVLE